MRGILVLCGVLIASTALAYDAAPPHSYTKPTANGKHVLVILHKWDAPNKKLQEKYERSGLYPANDSTKPAWTCDWRADWESNVFASDDGIFALRVPDGEPGLRHWLLSTERPIPSRKPGWQDAPALYIYDRGQPFRTLALKDVFNCSRFTERDCYMGPVITIESFDDASGRVVISAEASGRKQTTTVAFRTGEVIEREGRGGPLEFLSPRSASGTSGEGRSWVSVILLGLLVVGGLSAVFMLVAFKMVRWQRIPKP